MEAPPLAIITVLYRSEAVLPAFVESLRRQTYTGWELVAVDCASPDASVATLERLFPEATVVRAGDNVGISGGNNLGIAYALERGHRWLFLTNNDVRFDDGFFEALLARADERTCIAPAVYLEGTDLLDDTSGWFDWRRAGWSPWLFGKPPPEEMREPLEVEMASLTALLLPAAAVRAAGPMDDRFWMYYEDFDFVQRVKDAGYRLLREPSARAWHRKSASSGGAGNPFVVYYANRNRLLLKRLHSTLPGFMSFAAWFLATRLVRTGQYLAHGQIRQVRAMWLGVFDFARGRLGRTVQV